MWVWSLSQEDPLEEGMETHSIFLAWRIPWTEEPGGLQPLGLQRAGPSWNTWAERSWYQNPALPPPTHMCACVLRHFRRIQLCATLWTAACHALLSVLSFRQEYWSELPCSPTRPLTHTGTYRVAPLTVLYAFMDKSSFTPLKKLI